MTVTLAMIVRDEARNLEDCVGPVKGLVDEIVIVDTGSADDTVARADGLGARVVHFPWRDSFSAARNAAIEDATGEWIFVLDGDDRIVPSQRALLASLFASLGDEHVGYMFGQVSLAEDGDYGSEVEQIRLFRRRADVRYTYRVHEQVGPAILESGGRIEHTGIRVVHLGYRDRGALAMKMARNFRLVELDAAEHPGDPVRLFYLGAALADLGRAAEAVATLESARALGDPTFGMGRALTLSLARALRLQGDRRRALEIVRRDGLVASGDAALACMEAELLVELGDVAAAEERLRRVAEPKLLLSIADICARVLMGETLLRLARFGDAEDCARRVLELRPGVEPAWRVLGDALLGQARYDEALALAERADAIGGGSVALAIRDAVDSCRAGSAMSPVLACRGAPWVGMS